MNSTLSLRKRIKHAANTVGRADMTGCAPCKKKMMLRANLTPEKTAEVLDEKPAAISE